MMRPRPEGAAAYSGATPAGHVAAHGVFDLSSPERYRASRRVTRVSILINALLAAGQILVGLLGRSQALVADGVHTLSDIVTDVFVLVALKHGAKAADAEHPYGHGRFETAATVILGAVLIAVAVGVAVNAGFRLAAVEPLPVPSPVTLLVAVVTILAKEGLYRYNLRVARRCRSSLLRANAWHHRSDALSSVIVLAGIGGSLAGFPYLDGIAAVGVAMMVARIGWELAATGTKELVDTGLEAEELERVRRTILSVDGVKALHLLRTRRAGGRAFVDVHIIVDGTISVSEGHHISEAVRVRLIEQIDSVTDVTVHIDPEDDELIAPSVGLPLRRELLERLQARLRRIPEAREIHNITLHYLNGRIHVEVLLPLRLAGPQAAQLQARFREAIADEPVIGSVDLYFH